MAEPTPSEGMPKKSKAAMAVLGTLAAIHTIKGVQQQNAQAAENQSPAQKVVIRDIPKGEQEFASIPLPSFVDVVTRGNGELLEKAQKRVKEQEGFIEGLTHDPWGKETPNVTVLRKHWETISKYIRLHGVPASIAASVALIENGGGVAKVSPKNAVGMFQLTEDAAADTKVLTRDKNENIVQDNRTIPEENIRGGTLYLARLYETFNDWGFALLAYNMGKTGVAQLIFDIAQTRGETLSVNPIVKGKSLTDEDFQVFAGYIKRSKLSIHQLLTHYWDGLDNESRTYVYKVAAATPKLEKLGIIKPERITFPNIASYQSKPPRGIVV